jgi:hypothetical protein
MKRQKCLLSSYYLFISFLFLINGCSKPVLKMPESLPPIVKQYKHISLNAGAVGMQNTGIYLGKSDLYTILATGSIDFCPQLDVCDYHDVRPEQGWPFMVRIGKDFKFSPLQWKNGHTNQSYKSGYIYIGYQQGQVDGSGEPYNPEYYDDDMGGFSVDIIVWEKEDYIQIADFFEKLEAQDPNNKAINDVLTEIVAEAHYQEINIAQSKASNEIEVTKKMIQELKEAPKEEKLKESKMAIDKKSAPDAEAASAELSKEMKITELETKLTELMATLGQLKEMKNKYEEEKKKSSLLSAELAERVKREKNLLIKLEKGLKTPPVIAIASPKDGSNVEANIIHLSGVAEDKQGLERIEIYINDKLLKKKIGRGIIVTEKGFPKRHDFSRRVSLNRGENHIKIVAVDSDGLFSEKILTIHKLDRRKKIWAAVIGINKYANVRQLKCAVNDAKAFYHHLVHYNRIPAENAFLLVNQEATLTKLRSTLGTHLKSKAGKEDMVIIYFAGHGAAEKDVMSPDGDGLEKYLLPYDADPKDLYATALPMEEVSRIFNRIRSERIIFIADSCYSGASGGRTISLSGMRANISDAFLDRIAGGKGRIILTASGAGEVSAEDEKLQHGIFTYFLLEGLRGKADTDKDGLVTVDEVYGYVSKHVPQATGQEQHPLILSVEPVEKP